MFSWVGFHTEDIKIIINREVFFDDFGYSVIHFHLFQADFRRTESAAASEWSSSSATIFELMCPL